MSSGSPVESVRRAFALLEELNRQRINSVQHLHEVTALPKSTIVRLLETLRLLGYVANDPRQGGYQVTSGVRGLSSGFHGDPLVVEAARSWAIEFTRRHKLPIGIAVFDQDAMVVRFSTTPDSPMSPFHATVNMRLPLLTRALGRAYIAFFRERNAITFLVSSLARLIPRAGLHATRRRSAKSLRACGATASRNDRLMSRRGQRTASVFPYVSGTRFLPPSQ
jgi:IclR family transcriptional regulator, mhp operon transcriptional activator